MRRLFLATALAAAACGGGAKPATAPIAGRGGEPAPSMTDPIAVLSALATAARTDDGAALDALVHPELGLWLWDQPGATVSPTLLVKAGGGASPTSRLAPSGMNEYWKESYWAHVAGGLDRGLTRLDREPADRFAPIYGDCGADDATGGTDLHAWLVVKDEFDDYYAQLLEDAALQLDNRVTGQLVHFRSWGLDVWLAEDQGRLWVAHVMVWTPCDA
ncbi:MAG TPA: hypothetical protein VM261_17505 [Kofleriaceae bacterium]|nr:hypothetical protein [Kofleriaceae bacterium]